MTTCASCGHGNGAAAKFCEECGARLDPVSASREQRKTVTVLFCDVTGSTALGESTDPEAMRALLARYFDRMKGIIESHGGTVEKFIGDAVMAVFGVPQVHEDDALRAVRAAVEMRDALPDLGVQARIGVTTGEVVTGTKERLATGDAVNVAARLEQAAKPGEILIGGKTLQLVREAVESEPVDALELKGKSEPVPAFRLVSAAGELTRRHTAPLIGRERERRLLMDAWERVISEKSCSLFTLLGAAGVGKSRLAAEFLADVDARVIRARCLSYGEGITYWPVVEVLAQLGVRPEEESASNAVAALLGENDGATTPDEIAWAVRKTFERAAADEPLVVVFDDVHWGEPAFLDLIEHVADFSRGVPILLLCIARPDLLERRAGWGGGKLNATAALLEALSSEETDELIDSLADLDDGLRERIREAAEGNPLFVEEMLAMVREVGNGDVTVPPTIQALLAARIDQLDSGERAVLERGAVEGKIFHSGAVEALSPNEHGVRERLMSLVRKELVRPERALLAGDDAFRFRHLLIRDAAYQTLPKTERATLHERFAAWLDRVATGAEYQAIAGYHLEQAYRYLLELGPADAHADDLARRAGELLAAAGEDARSLGDLGGAISLLRRAAELLPDSPERLRVLTDLGDVLNWSGELAEAEQVLSEAIALAQAAGDERARLGARMLQVLLRSQVETGAKTDAMRAEAEAALPVLTQSGDDRALARAWRLLAQAHNVAGQMGEMVDASREAAVHAHAAGDRREEAEALRWVISGTNLGRTPVPEAIEICQRVLAEGPAVPRLVSSGLVHLAHLYARLGRTDEARGNLAEAKRMNHEYGLKLAVAAYAMFDCWIERALGTPANAIEPAREGCRLLEEMGETAFRSTVLAELGHCLYSLGEYAESEKATLESEQAAAPDDVVSQTRWRLVRGACLARRGLLEEGERLTREAVALADNGDSLDAQGDTRVMLADVLRLGGRDEEACAALEEADRIYATKGWVPEANPARKALSAASSPISSAKG